MDAPRRPAGAPFLHRIASLPETVDQSTYPFNIRAFSHGIMRAESFYNFATYLDEVSDLRAYGGKSLHEQSHGESFISLFANRFEQGIYILDEPEGHFRRNDSSRSSKSFTTSRHPGMRNFSSRLTRRLS